MKTKSIAEIVLHTHNFLCAESFDEFCAKIAETIAQKENGDYLFIYKDGSELVRYPNGGIHLDGIIRKMGRFVLTRFEPFDDGSVTLIVNESGKSAHQFTCEPEIDGFDVKKFNPVIGTMDKYFTLNIERKNNEDLIEKLFESCVYYLDGNHVEGFANIKVEMGERVICDFCGVDYTQSNQTGGFLYGSYATCPDCAPEKLKFAKEHNELKQISELCPEGMSFKDFVLTILR